MTLLRFASRLVFTLASSCTLDLSAVFAAPPPAIAGLIGEWSGESSRTATGEPAAQRFSDARRYWVEGDAVRGEILVGVGNSLQTVHVAIVPRLGHFLKTVTAEDGHSNQLVGLPAEDGVLWTPLSGDNNRFIERVTGEREQRRLELLVPDGDPTNPGWRVTEALQPAAGAMSGVVGGGVAGPESNPPLQLPPEAELVLLDRVAELQRQRDAARGDTANLSRELAGAWRESENAGARAKALETELAELKSAQSAAAAPAQADEARTRVEAAEKDALAARQWADELEKSLRSALTKAEDATVRAAALGAELTAAKAAAQQAATDTATATSELAARSARVAELEVTVETLEQKNIAAAAAVAEAGQAQPTVARVAEVERALNASQTELEAVTTAREHAVREAAALGAAKTELEAQLAAIQVELAAANTSRIESEEQLAAAQGRLAAAERQQHDVESRAVTTAGSGTRIAELEQEVQAAAALVAQRETELTAARSERDSERVRVAQLEQQLAAATSGSAVASDAAARLATAEQDLLGAREQLAAAAAQRTQAEQGMREAHDVQQRTEAQLTVVARERDAARAAVATLEARIDAWAKEAPPATEDHSKRVAALEKELEVVRGQLATANTQGGAMANRLQVAADAQTRAERELAQARQTLAEEHSRAVTLEAQLAEARKAAAPGAADAARRAGLENELVAARGEIALAQNRRAELERELQAARAASESDARLRRQADEELNAARLRVAELEGALETERSRVAAVERERPRTAPERTVDARVADLEIRLADSVARVQQRQDEIDRLTVRVRELEAGAPASAVAPSFAIAAPPAPRASESAAPPRRAPATPPPAATPTRPAPRSEVTVASTPAPAPAVATEASVGFRLSPAPSRPSSAPRLPPTRPADNRVSVIPGDVTGADPTLASAVRALPVNGYRRAGANSIVIIGGRPFKPGEVVDAVRGLKLARIDSNAIVFTGPTGAEYRFQL